MSGIEIAGLVFGVLPLLIEAVKAYGTVSAGLTTFRHWSREVRSVSVQLKVHHGIFLNECRLLLRLIEDDKGAEAMLENHADERWTSKSVNDGLNTVLRNNLDLCRSIIEETQETINDLQQELSKFDVLHEKTRKGEKLKATIKRLRGAVSIAFDKPSYEKCIANLRDRNGDLSSLRSHIDAFQQSARATSTLIQYKSLPSSFTSIRDASQKLHEALCGAWCCDDALHRGHFAKLCLEAKVEAGVHLDMAISCLETTNSNQAIATREHPLWLYVQTMNVASDTQIASTSTDTPEPSKSPNVAVMPPLEEVSSTNARKNKASANAEDNLSCRKKKVKRVHFDHTTTPDLPSTLHSILGGAQSLLTSSFNLCQTKNMCLYLKSNYSACDTTANCVGYLETPQLYRHLFFAKKAQATENLSSTVHTIFDIMKQDPDDVLSIEDQLRLAHRTAIALLQYNDTPWLPEKWRLGQLSYFGTQRTFDATALKTLHLSSQLCPTEPQPASITMDGVEQQTVGVSDEVRYGINNLPLFFLGVALLEIAHWQPLEKKMIARDFDDQVYAARRLAAGRAPLGPDYQKIAQKCLQCNFGFGTRLDSKGLQAAVYNDVVCGLEGMIEKLVI